MKIKKEQLKCPKCLGEIFNIFIIGMENDRLEIFAVCNGCNEPISTNTKYLQDLKGGIIDDGKC